MVACQFHEHFGTTHTPLRKEDPKIYETPVCSKHIRRGPMKLSMTIKSSPKLELLIIVGSSYLVLVHVRQELQSFHSCFLIYDYEKCKLSHIDIFTINMKLKIFHIVNFPWWRWGSMAKGVIVYWSSNNCKMYWEPK